MAEAEGSSVSAPGQQAEGADWRGFVYELKSGWGTVRGLGDARTINPK